MKVIHSRLEASHHESGRGFIVFARHFTRDAWSEASGGEPAHFATVEKHSPGFCEFMLSHGGCSFDDGVYRVIPLSQVNQWNASVSAAFPQYQGRMVAFGFDWLGRCFALDATRQKEGQLLVVLLEPGTGEVLKAPVTFTEFHDVELAEYRNDSVASDFFTAWKESGGSAPGLNECIGYNVPLFLGGEDVVENLEMQDLDVYWSICSQLLEQTRDLPDGTSIGESSID